MRSMLKRWLNLVLSVFRREPLVQCKGCSWSQADNYITGLNGLGVYGFSVCGYNLANNRIVDSQALRCCDKYIKGRNVLQLQ
jgi:hypothetical protein